MKKSTTMRQLLLALMCLFGLNASAQFSATLKQGPTSDYSNVGHQFKLTEVAEALGTDTATLVAQLSDMENTKVFAVIDSTGTVNTYTGNPGEFWLTKTGQVHEYNGGAWFVGQNFDEENDIFNVYVGQMPNYFTASDTLQVKAALVYGGKTVTFDMTYQVYVPQAPAAELAISKLNIVGEAAASIEQYPRSAYDMDKVYVKVSDLAEKLGASKEDLSYIVSKITYLPKVDQTYGMMSDSLTSVSTNDGWMKRTIDSKGDSTWSCGSNAYDNTDVLYTNSFSYNADNDTLTCQIGQYPKANKVGDKPNFDAYLVYGDKAYKVNYTVNIIEAPYHGLYEMTQVGDTTITTSQMPTNDYSTTSIYPNMTAIAAALGVAESDVQMQAIDANGNLTSEYSANNGGFWLTQAGIKTDWGTGAYFFVEPASNGNYTDIHVGQYPDVAQSEDTARATLYFVNADKYYSVNVVLAIEKSKNREQSQFESVAKRTVTIQGLPGDYQWSTTDSSIPVEDINAAIGTTSPVLYAYISDSLRRKSPDAYPETMVYTKTYNMNPDPGFWLDKDGKSMGWTSDAQSPWGICTSIADGKYTFKAMQYAADQPGTAYSGQFFLVNEETGKMMTVTLNYQVVSVIQTITEVGSTDITLPVGDTDQEVDFDLAPVAEALGTDVTTLISSYSLVGRNASGVYTEGVDPVQTGLMFTNDGACDNNGGNIGIQFSDDGTKIIIYANATDELGAGYKADATIGFEMKGENDETKIYLINITFMNAEDYATGIDGIRQNAKKDGKIYDLSGRQVSKPAHGLYIMNGKKYVVK